MDMALAIHRINPAAAYRLNATHDAVVEWRGPGPQPTAQQITDAWNAIEAERTAREQEAAAIAVLRQALGQELSRRLTTAPGKTFAQLTDREILHMLVRERFGALQNVGIFDANGVVQPLDRWRV